MIREYCTCLFLLCPNALPSFPLDLFIMHPYLAVHPTALGVSLVSAWPKECYCNLCGFQEWSQYPIQSHVFDSSTGNWLARRQRSKSDILWHSSDNIADFVRHGAICLESHCTSWLLVGWFIGGRVVIAQLWPEHGNDDLYVLYGQRNLDCSYGGRMSSTAADVDHSGAVQWLWETLGTYFSEIIFPDRQWIWVIRHVSGARGPFYSWDLSYNSFSCIK